MYYLLARTLSMALSSHKGRLIIGLVIIFGGIFYGLTSHQMNYKSVPEGRYQISPLNDGSYAFSQDGTDVYYIVHPTDFLTAPTDASFTSTDGIGDVVYQDENPKSFKMEQKDGSSIESQEYTVVHFSLTSSKDGNNLRFSTNEYMQDPDGIYINNWPTGIIVATLGLGALGFFLMLPTLRVRKLHKAQPAFVPTVQSPNINDAGLASMSNAYPLPPTTSTYPYAPMNTEAEQSSH